MHISQSPRGDNVRFFSTGESAQILGIQAQSLRAAYCRTGAYFGVIPLKAPNRFLRWPADGILRLIAGEADK
ncbi:hypothetical protein [Accumulibacter sp.]|uniref:hypothetical protein n=1 Tax=Accumulibacter sp. TaxID=2053492 RepID=UPI0025904BF7|nr:hypothetical protein [Accumulibacter sp.]